VEEDVGRYWMSLRKGEERILSFEGGSHCGELALEEALDLSQDRLLNAKQHTPNTQCCHYIRLICIKIYYF